MSPKCFVSKIYFFTANEHGRRTPPATGYRPNFSFDGGRDLLKANKNIVSNDWLREGINADGVIYFNADFMPLGQHLRCYLSFSSVSDRLDNILKEGVTFYITELLHVVGKGVIESTEEKIPDEIIDRYNTISIDPLAKTIVEKKFRGLMGEHRGDEIVPE